MALTKISGNVIKDSVSLAGNVSIGGTLTYEDVTNIDSLGIGTFRAGVNVSGGQIDVGSNIKLGNAGVITATTFSGDPAGTGNINAGILDLKTGGNIRLRFSSGGTAQFRGDTDPIANFDRGSANSTNVKWGYLGADRGIISSISNEFRITASGTTPMTFHSNGNERLRIASGGQVIIGDDDIDKANGHFDDLIVGANASTTETHGITIVCGNAATNGGIAFSDGSAGGADAYRGMIGYQHNDNHMQFRTNATERLRIKSNGTVNIGTNNQASGDSSSKLRVGQASGSDTGVVVFGNADTTTPALVITNWDGAQTQNKSVIHFDNSGWGSHQIGSLAGSDGFGIYDDSVLRMSINNVGNTTFHSTGHIVLPSGTTSQRVNTTGAIRYNSSLGNLEFYDGSSWKRVRLLESAPTTGLLAYWPFSSASRSGSTYNDVSGNGQHLTVNGTITNDTTETKFSGCIDFGTADGNHYLKSSSNSFTDIDATSGFTGLSISVWVKTSGTQNQWIISEGTVNTRWAFFNESANAPKWRSTTGHDITQTGSILTGNWHHLVVTYNHSNRLVQHYRDGSLINSGTVGAQASFTGGYLLVGQHSSLAGNVGSYRWRGKMAHMRLYNRVLTSTEVTTLHQQW